LLVGVRWRDVRENYFSETPQLAPSFTSLEVERLETYTLSLSPENITLAHWSDVEFEKLRARDNARGRAMDRLAFDKGEKCAAAPDIFQRLFETVAEDVKKLNSQTDISARKLREPERIGTRRFQVLRGGTPEFTLIADFDPESPCIRYSTAMPARGKVGAFQSEARFDFYLQDTGEVVLSQHHYPRSLSEASQQMLFPSIDGYRP
jgi:hypothetical protein